MSALSVLFSEEPNRNRGAKALAHRQREEAMLEAQRAALAEQARGFHASVVLTQSAALISQADALARVTPVGRQAFGSIALAYAVGGANRIANFEMWNS